MQRAFSKQDTDYKTLIYNILYSSTADQARSRDSIFGARTLHGHGHHEHLTQVFAALPTDD